LPPFLLIKGFPGEIPPMNPKAAVTPDENRRVIKDTIPKQRFSIEKMNPAHQLNN
jgi:hypothetical protein